MYSKRLISFINHYHANDSVLFWPDLATVHYAGKIQQLLIDNGISYVQRGKNLPNVLQARPIETIRTLLKHKVYENNWVARNLDPLARRIPSKVKIDKKVVANMSLGVRKKLLRIYRKGVYSIC